MGSKSALKSRPPSFIPSRMSFPLVIFLCGVFFFVGFLFGQRPLQELPEIRLADKVGSSTLNLGKGDAIETNEGEEGNRRQLASSDLDNLSLLQPMDHGESGDNEILTIPFQLISWHPRAYVFPNFLSHDKCDEIVKIAKRSLAPSGLALRPGELAENSKDVRTSQGTFLVASHDRTGTLKYLDEKIAKVTMVPSSHGEAYNVLRYEIGQKYDSHFDTFNPEEYGPQSSMRVASFLTYLTDVDEGGETMFPYEGYKNMDVGYDFKACIGLKVKPRKGDGLLFWSMFHNGSIDKAALHGSCPVVKGQKFVATKWIRDKPIHGF